MYHYSHTIGMLALVSRGFSNPLDLDIDARGLLYVINRSNFHQQAISVRINICSADGKFISRFSHFSAADGGLIWPTSIAIDRQGAVYVADEHRNDIQVFSREGEYRRKWGGLGVERGKMSRPAGLGIAADGGIFVSDQMNDRIQKFSPEGECIWEAGGKGRGPGEMDKPWGIAEGKDGHIYVADWGNDRVQVYGPNGEYIWSFGTSGAGVGQLKRPAGIAVDGERVYVADWGNDRVQVFGIDGTIMAALYGDADLSLRAREWLAEEDPDMVARRQHADFDVERRFWGPTAVRVDKQGRVFVVDSCRHRIQVYQRDN